MFNKEQDFQSSGNFFDDLLNNSDQDQTLLQDLELIMKFSLCINESQKLNHYLQIQNRLQKQLDPIDITKLYSKISKDYHIFRLFSLWILQSNMKTRSMSLMRCVMLLSLSFDPPKKQQARTLDQYQRQESQNKDFQFFNNLASNERKDNFLEQKQNQQILSVLINKQLFRSHQSFIWRQLLFKINSQNVENTLQIAKTLYDMKNYQKTISVLLSISFSHKFQSEADLLRGLAHKQIKQFQKAQQLMKLAVSNKNNPHPSRQKCLFQIAELCYQMHRYAEAAHAYSLCLSKYKTDIKLRLKYLKAMFYAKTYYFFETTVCQLIYLDYKGFKLSLQQRGQICLYRARFLEINQKKNEYKQVINRLYKQAHNYYKKNGEQLNSVQNRLKFFRTKYLYEKGEQLIEAKIQFENCLKYSNFPIQARERYLVQALIYLTMCVVKIQPIEINEFILYLDSIIESLNNLKQQILYPDFILYLNEMLRVIKKNHIIDWNNIKQSDDQKKENLQLIYIKLIVKRYQKKLNQKLKILYEWTQKAARKLVQNMLLSWRFFFNMKKYDISLIVLSSAKEMYDEYQILYRLSGFSYLQLQEYQKAQNQFRLALKRDSMSLQSLKGLFFLISRKQNQQQMLKIGERIISKYKQIKLSQAQKEKYQQQEECKYKWMLRNILMKQRNFKKVVLYMRQGLKFYPVDLQYYTIGLKLYFGYRQAIYARELLEQIQKYKNRKDVSLKDLVSVFVLVGEKLKLQKYLDNKELQIAKEEQLQIVVRTIIELSSCPQGEIKKRSHCVMDYLTHLKSHAGEEMSFFRFTAVAYRTAEVLYSRQAYKEATQFYSQLTVQLHLQISEKLHYCTHLAREPQAFLLLQERLKILQKEFLLSSSKPTENLFYFNLKNIDKRLLQLFEIYEKKSDQEKQNALIEQLIKETRVMPSQKVSFLQNFFKIQHQRREYKLVEKSVKNLKSILHSFLFYLYFENQEGLFSTLGMGLKQMAANQNNRTLVLSYKVSMSKKGGAFTKVILEIIQQFNKSKSKNEFIGQLDTLEKTKQFISLRKQVGKTNNQFFVSQ